MKKIKKIEYSLQEIADRERLEAKKAMEADGYRRLIKGLSVTTIAAVIMMGVTIKCEDNNKDHLEEYCAYCDILGLNHQQKMIKKQYGTEAFATELKDNKQELAVYYLDDQGKKVLIKEFNKRR